MCCTPLPKRRHTTSDTTVTQCQPITDAVVLGMLVHFLDLFVNSLAPVLLCFRWLFA